MQHSTAASNRGLYAPFLLSTVEWQKGLPLDHFNPELLVYSDNLRCCLYLAKQFAANYSSATIEVIPAHLAQPAQLAQGSLRPLSAHYLHP